MIYRKNKDTMCAIGRESVARTLEALRPAAFCIGCAAVVLTVAIAAAYCLVMWLTEPSLTGY